ncbi:MAG: Npt1/Npt2 family nucleotide transporter [Deltaproteobacteria bacterium]
MRYRGNAVLGRVEGTRAAAFTSAAMIAHQVAGKAARDALFLTSFSVRALPSVMAVGAVLSLGAALWISRLLTRYSPASLLPILFGTSMSALVIEWAIGLVSPAATAVAVFLHTAVFGPLLVSAFWSLINERFDPHTARRAVGRIALGGTVGGVLGALMAWRVATLVELRTVVLLLAAMHGACLVGTLLLRAHAPRREAGTPEPVRAAEIPAVVLLRREPYLRNLALLVAISAATSGLLDFLFSRQAAATFAKGPALLTFFALFWLAVAVLSLLIQLTLGQRALQKLGIAANVAILPGAVLVAGAIGLALPGFLSTSFLRGVEAVERNTLYRSAYELLYTPLSEVQKRSIKAQIDIGFDRLGTITAAGIVALLLAISATGAATYILVAAMLLAVVTLRIARRLHAGYVAALEHGLRDGASKLALPSLASHGGSHAQTAEDLERESLIQRVELLRPRHDPLAVAGADIADPDQGGRPALAALRAPRDLLDGRELFAGDPEVAAATLRRLPLEATTPVTGFVILLLAHKRLHAEALAALCRAAPVATGQLIDALLDPSMDFVVRRRIPSALAACASQRAADGLLLGIADERFEVRYACGRALMKISEANPGIVISRQKIVQAILIEVDLKAPGATALEFEADPSEIEEASALVDNLLARDRVDRTLEHVFTILGLHLEREPMRMAYRALRHPDVRHRGTALEYLQTILPNDLRDAVWPLVGALAPLPAARGAREILADLLRATVVKTKQGSERD